jgi:Rrf2 family protein
MIKLSTKGRYGTRLMVNLALHYNIRKEPVVLENISKDEEVSLRYLEQIVILLKINKLVVSVRGAGGGYVLSRHPSKIKLMDILEALEGPICLVDCVDDNEYCHRIPICAAHEIWKESTFMLRDYFQKKTLQDLMKISKKKSKDS